MRQHLITVEHPMYRQEPYPLTVTEAGLVFALLVLASVGCATAALPATRTPSATPTATAAPPIATPMSDWERDWLKGVPCKPPCWEGITPGRTTPSQAVTILDQNPLFSNAENKPSSDSRFGDVYWNLNNGERGGRIFYHADLAGQPIYMIDPNLTANFRLGDIIAMYGEPRYVIADAAPAPPPAKEIGRRLDFIFQEQGFAVSVADIPIALNPDMRTVHPIFFVPSELGRSEAIPFPTDSMSPWQGYKDYTFYCHDADGGRSCSGK